MDLQILDQTQRKKIIRDLKKKYPVGKRIALVNMTKPNSSFTPGLKGTVKTINDDGGIRVNWDNGISSTVEYETHEIRPIN